jgi:predicted nucleic acid-binding protein
MTVKDNCLLDTSALFAYTDGEEGSGLVGKVLEEAENGKQRIYISAITVMELYYITHQEIGEEAARELVILIRSLPVQELPLSEDLILPAGDLKARYRISVADAWIGATAKFHGLKLIHKDPEFEPLKDELLLTELPYKGKRVR